MNVEVDTIASFFGLDPAHAHKNAAALAKKAKQTFAQAAPGVLRGEAAQGVMDAGHKLLDSPMASIFGDAWSTARDLHKFCNSAEYPPEKISEYPLGEHEFALKRTPQIEIVYNGVPSGFSLECELKLAITVLSAVLRIQAGRIIGARIGDCLGGGKYSCAKVTLAERKTGKFTMPGDVSFAPGLPLGKPYA